MSAGTPFIGSKINLISKAEIRYQGTLYQVDTKEATVTLAKVRSFGTENRQVPKAIPPRNETYEFIIFRGSDIKDLNVIDVPSPANETDDPAPQDPAIVSATHIAQRPPPPPMSQPSVPAQPRQPAYNPFPPPNIYSPFGMPYVRPPVMIGARGAQHPPPPMNTSHPAHAVPIHQHPQEPPHPLHQDQLPRAPGAPVSLPIQAPPPTVISQGASTSQTSTTATGVPSLIPPPAPGNGSEPQASSTPLVPGTFTTETTPKASLPLEFESPGVVTRAQPSLPVPNQQVQPPPPASAFDGGRDNRPQVDSTTPSKASGRGKGEREQRGGRRGRNQNRSYEGRGGYSRRGGYQGNSRGAPRGGYRSQQQRPPRGGGGGARSNGPVYRYDSEFDFESANARFKKENLEEEFKQMHVDDRNDHGSRRTSESHYEEEAVNGLEVGVASNEGHLDGDVDSGEDDCYDKSKSFFDSISREINGPGRRPDRSAERELNTETFGVSNYRGYYNRYQGRGRGRGRGHYGNRRGNRYNRGGGGGGGSYGNRQGRRYSERSNGSSERTKQE